MSVPCKTSSAATKLILVVVLPLIVCSVIIVGRSSFGFSISLNSSVSENTESERPLLTHNEGVLFSTSSNINGSSSSSSSSQDVFIRSKNVLNSVTISTRAAKTFSKLQRLEAGLARARAGIRNASQNKTSHEEDRNLLPLRTIYRNRHEFHQSYLEMEKIFKIFIYEEGSAPLFHDGPCKGIYSTEGMFIQGIEFNKHFRTWDPDRAHVYFLPFSIGKMVRYLYVRDSHDIGPIKRTVVDYANFIARKYPYWNRSLGADHFILSCHDWAPHTSSYVPYLYKNSIRAFCNANTSEGFYPSKDVSFPEINLRKGHLPVIIDGLPPSNRTILAFFAGKLHGTIRIKLLEHWKDKDEEVVVYERLPKELSYGTMMRKSKFCLCPSGYEVASPRIVEAIYSQCVPVLLSDHYIPPFSDILNWNSFSVQLSVNDIPNLKKILMGISEEHYMEMHRNLKQVRSHFMVNDPPVRFDAFHMTIHSIWLRRLNIRIN
ncbi:Exostosin-like [Macleaya cordata]|uniref:Exostosin-like n=1 Tax=Macleaya cordata TaxID=56857 RepID=A0A200PM29_MACCD|nr:Exostosin-like [Macleaya cordata]